MYWSSLKWKIARHELAGKNGVPWNAQGIVHVSEPLATGSSSLFAGFGGASSGSGMFSL